MNTFDKLKELSLHRLKIKDMMLRILKDKSIPLKERYQAMLRIHDFNLTSVEWVFDEEEVKIIEGWEEQ